MPDEVAAKETITARVDPIALDRLRELSAARDRSLSYLINAAVVQYLAAQECEAAE